MSQVSFTTTKIPQSLGKSMVTARIHTLTKIPPCCRASRWVWLQRNDWAGGKEDKDNSNIALLTAQAVTEPVELSLALHLPQRFFLFCFVFCFVFCVCVCFYFVLLSFAFCELGHVNNADFFSGTLIFKEGCNRIFLCTWKIWSSQTKENTMAYWCTDSSLEYKKHRIIKVGKDH